jgi:hypothetical protein
MYGVTDMAPIETYELRRQIGELKAALAYIANPYGLTPLNQSAVPAEQWHRFATYKHRVEFAQRTLERLG